MTPAAEASRGRPVVTAVIVAHDGARWLPHLLATLEQQTRLPDRLVAVDTGSHDDSRAILARVLGDDAVLTTDRTLGFGAAVARGLAAADERGEPGGAEWLWLLHDDMQLDQGALEHLVRAATDDVALVGPKVREWPQRLRLLEMGLTTTGTARRLTGVDPGEYDQGQHDRVTETLAVGSAGMLVRRDVWDALGGFDPALPLFGDDLDLGWRAARAGHRAVVVPDAVVFHAEAATRGRRSVDAARGRPHLLARRHALHTVLANCRGWAVPPLALRLLVGSVLRALGLLLVKAPRDAWSEVVAAVTVAGNPVRIARARRYRRSGRSGSHSARALLAPWWTPYARGMEVVAQVAVEAVDAIGERGRRGREQREAETGPVADEAQNLATEPGLLARAVARPMGAVLLALVLLSLVAGPDLFGAGLLSGGALLPAPPAAGDWWRAYAESWHPVALGSDQAASPYVAVLAALGTLLLGKSWLVVDILVGLAVPLTAVAGYVLARRLVQSRAVAVWVAVTYGLLPVVTGALAQGRIGTLVGGMVLPLLLRAGIGVVGAANPARRWRASFGGALLLALLAAFVPIALPMAALVAVGVGLWHARDRVLWLRLLTLVVVAALLLLPWLLGLGMDTARWYAAEAGHETGLGATGPTGRWGLALGRPPGPGAAPAWVTAGLVLAALVALMRTDRRRLVLSAWAVGLVGLSAAVAQLRDGAWPGFAVLVVQGAAIVATAVLADGLAERLSGASFGWRQPLVGVVAVAALVAPVLSLGWWVFGSADDLLERRASVPLPAFMADAQRTPAAPRTLLLTRDGDALEVHLSRGPGVYLGQDSVLPTPPRQLADLAARLVTEPTQRDVATLARHGVGYVLVLGEDDRAVAAVDGAPGLVRSSSGEVAGTAWRLDAPAGPVRVSGSGPQRLGARVLPSAPGGLTADLGPAGSARALTLGERPDPDWRADLGPEALHPGQVTGSQAFAVPGDGGRLAVEHESARGWWLALQATVLLVALVLAAPGRRGSHAPL